MTSVDHKARRDAVVAAREVIAQAIVGLEIALADVAVVTGTAHDAARSISAALDQTRVAGAKIDLVIKRIPQ